MGTRALVYGSRVFNNRSAVFNFLDRLHRSEPIGLLIHGACKNRLDPETRTVIWSADMLAEEWAKSREIPYCGWPAQWRTGTRGRGEGMIRNQRMLEKTRPTLGVEFPGGSGTQDMRERLQKAGIPIAQFVNGD
jgi:hypothetical protein